jgi:hypothetical protein
VNREHPPKALKTMQESPQERHTHTTLLPNQAKDESNHRHPHTLLHLPTHSFSHLFVPTDLSIGSLRHSHCHSLYPHPRHMRSTDCGDTSNRIDKKSVDRPGRRRDRRAGEQNIEVPEPLSKKAGRQARTHTCTPPHKNASAHPEPTINKALRTPITIPGGRCGDAVITVAELGGPAHRGDGCAT